jgi:mutator protein MutT
VQYSINVDRPCNFQAIMEVACCICLWGDKMLLLKRRKDKPEGGVWCFPGGKLELGETPVQAVVRELFEEVGLDVHEQLQKVQSVYVQKETKCFVLHLFVKEFSSCPTIALEVAAHEDAIWMTAEESSKLPLILGFKDLMSLYKKSKK